MKLSFSDQKPLKAIDVVVKAMKGVKHKVPVSSYSVSEYSGTLAVIYKISFVSRTRYAQALRNKRD